MMFECMSWSNTYISYFSSKLNDGYMDEPPVYAYKPLCYSPYGSRYQYRGQLLQKKSYDSTGRLRKHVYIQYEPLMNDMTSVYSLMAQILESRLFQFRAVRYKIYTYRMVRSFQTELTYSENSDKSTFHGRFFSYNRYGQVTKDSTVCYAGNNIETETVNYEYAWETIQLCRDHF